MIVNKIVVAIPKTIASNAAKSREFPIPANVIIIGLMVWNCFPPTIIGAATADNPLRKIIIVNANKVGVKVGKTTFLNTVKGFAPILRAASIV